jgi:hypothetical protein
MRVFITTRTPSLSIEISERTNAMFLKPFGLKVILVGAIGLALLLVGSLSDLYENVVEQRQQHEVLANGKEAMALVLRSSGFQSVILSWADFDGQSRTGEARTRKQVSGDRRFVGKRVAIKYLDPPFEPVILSEIEDRERETRYWINSSLWISSVILVGCALVGLQVLRGRFR